MRRIILLAFLIILSCQNTNFTYTTSNLNPTTLYMTSKSTKDFRYITSQKMEDLKISGSSPTSLTLDRYSRTAMMNQVQQSLTMTNSWFHLSNTDQSLSCTILMESTASSITFIKSNSTNLYELGTVTNLSFIPQFNSSLPGLYLQHLKPAQDCQLVRYFSNNGTADPVFFYPSSNWSSLTQIPFPAGWVYQASSSSLLFSVAGDKLYRFNNGTNTFDAVQTFPTHLRYQLFSYQDRVVVLGANFYPSNMSATFNAYILHVKTSGAVLIETVTIAGVTEATTPFEIKVSPQATKIVLYYELTNGTSGLTARHVDYSADTTLVLQWDHPAEFSQLVKGINKTKEFVLSENFLVVRNASLFRLYNPQIPALEVAFQFLGSKVAFLNARDLSANLTSNLTANSTNSTNSSNNCSANSTNNTNNTNGTNSSSCTYYDPLVAADPQLGLFQQMWIDETETTQLNWLGRYEQSSWSSNYDIEFLNYTNVAQTYGAKSSNMPYINFTVPPKTSQFSFQGNFTMGDHFQWIFTTFNSTSYSTSIDAFNMDHSQPNHYNSTTFELLGDFTPLASSPKCFVIYEKYGNSSIRMFNYDSIANIYTEDITNLTTMLSNSSTPLVNETTPSQWAISQNCDRFRVGVYFFSRANSSVTWSPMTNPAAFDALALDKDLDYAVSSDGKLYKFNSTSNGFGLYYTPAPLFEISANSTNKTDPPTITRYLDRLVINGSNFTGATSLLWIRAYLIEANNSLTPVFDFSSTRYELIPTVTFSPQLTLVAVVGTGNLTTNNSLGAMANAFRINWATKTYQTIAYPDSPLVFGKDYFIALGEEFLFSRQLRYSSYYYWMPMMGSNNFEEHLYYLANTSTIPMLVYNRTAGSSNDYWSHADILTNSSGTFLYNQMVQRMYNYSTWSYDTEFVVVNVSQISPGQAIFNSQHNHSYQAVPVGTHLQVCPPGCVDCSCQDCLEGYTRRNTSQFCFKCHPNCATCRPENISRCLSCVPGMYLDIMSGGCNECVLPCVSCNFMGCSKCLPTYNVNSMGNNCTFCSSTCKTCSLFNNCSQCMDGYTFTTNGTNCQKCSLSCSSCDSLNVTKCTSCGKGLILNNDQCEPCPAHCMDCTASACFSCFRGFSLNSNGVCVANCKLPCITCADNQPNNCTSCQQGSILNANGTCSLDNACSTSNTCSNCGQGLGYFLIPSPNNGGSCQPCLTTANCLQCNALDPYACAICSYGYHLETNGSCVQCPAMCATCGSSVSCTSCAAGYTFIDAATEGRCIKCASPCATCYRTADYCTSCLANFTRKGWHCVGDNSLSFSFTLHASSTLVLEDTFFIGNGLAQILGQSSNTLIYFQSVVDDGNGWTSVSAIATPIQVTVATAENYLREGILTGIPGIPYSVANLQITSSSGNFLSNATTIPRETTYKTYSLSPTNLYSIDRSSAMGFWLSKGVDNLVVSPASGTSVNITSFDRNSFNNNSQATYSLNDTRYLESAQNKSFSCIVLEYRGANFSYTFLKSTPQNISLVGTVDATFITPAYNSSLNATEYGVVEGGLNCDVVKYTPANQSSFTLFKPSSNWTALTPITLPSGWNWQANSEDLMFMVSANKLYKFTTSSQTYELVYTFGAFSNYQIFNNYNSVVVAASNSVVFNSSASPPTSSSSYWVYVFNVAGQTAAPFSSFALTSILEDANSKMRILLSPNATKLLLTYNKTDGSEGYTAKHIDYSLSTATDLQFENSTDFHQSIRGIQPYELALGDYFMVVRNASLFRLYNLPARALEVAYQFVNNQVRFLKARDLSQPFNASTVSNDTGNSNLISYCGANVTNGTNGTNCTTIFGSYQNPQLQANREWGDFHKMWIDPTQKGQLFLLYLYKVNSTVPALTYDVDFLSYENVQLAYNVSKPSSPPYVNFSEPQPFSHFMAFDTNSTAGDHFQWIYVQEDLSANRTLVGVYNLDHSKRAHYNISSFQLFNKYTLVAHSLKCLVLHGTEFRWYNYNSQSGTYTLDPFNFTTIFNSNATNNSTYWNISDDCNRFSFNDTFYYRDNSGNFALMTPSTFNAQAFDSNMEYAIGLDNNIYAYSATTNGFSQVLAVSPNVSFSNSSSSILRYQNRLVINGSYQTDAWVYAYSIGATGALTHVFNYTSSKYQVRYPPAINIELSPMLTNVFIVGEGNTTVNGSYTWGAVADCFRIDWVGGNHQNITFPAEALIYGADYFLTVGQEFFYTRQLQRMSSSIWNHRYTEHVYYLAQGTNPYPLYVRNISLPNTLFFKYANIESNSSGTYLYVEMDELQTNGTTSFKLLYASQLSKAQAVFNNEWNGTFSGELVNNKVKICPPGCSDCNCSTCLNGYVNDPVSGGCLKCAAGCLSCYASNTSRCTGCRAGTYFDLSSASCFPCNETCLTCSLTSTSCGICHPGLYFASTQCSTCPANCFKCSSGSVCQTCNRGFTLALNGTLCRQCSIFCATCNPDNIMECYSCGKGLYLTNGQCSSCSSNCVECTATACIQCSKGFTLNYANLCVQKCELPCVTCADNVPSVCTSCQEGSNLWGTQCFRDITCNNDNSCTYCGQGHNYFLVPTSTTAGYCAQCPTIANCIQCDSLDEYSCSVCKNGYYADTNGTCSACNGSCTGCVSNETCTSCADGYTFSELVNEGVCIPCESPCARCEGNPTSCTSCLPGFFTKGVKCKNVTFVAFSFVLTANITTILLDIDNIKIALYVMLAGNGTNSSNVTAADTTIIDIQVIATGSTVISGSTSPITGTPADASAALSSGLTSGLPGYTVASSQVSVQTEGATSTEESSTSIGVIIGAVVGALVAIVAVVIIVVLVRRRQLQSVATSDQEDHIVIEKSDQMRINNDSFDHAISRDVIKVQEIKADNY